MQADPPSLDFTSQQIHSGVRIMTATHRTSFDVSPYIGPIIGFEKPRDLVYFTPYSYLYPDFPRNPFFTGLPGYRVKPSSLPLCIADYATQRYPRGIPYEQFPILADPYCALIDPWRGRGPEDGTATISRQNVETLIKGQDIFVYDEAGYGGGLTDAELDDALYLAIRAHRILCEDKPFYYRKKDQADFQFVPTSKIEAKIGGWQRFRFSYRVNFHAIARRAMIHVLARYPMPDPDSSEVVFLGRSSRHFGALQVYFVGGHQMLLDDPIALQILYWLRGLNKREQKALFVFFHDFDYTDRKPCAQLSFGNRIANGLWVGSGKYKFGFNVTMEVLRTLGQARALGFVTDDRDDLIALTAAGEAFLHSLHTDNDDPDALHRFMDPDTLSMPFNQIARIDAWMMRFFRKMKAKINSLS